MDFSNDNSNDIDMPIALRKGKRRSSVLTSEPNLSGVGAGVQSIMATPSRRSKRVRFSDSYLPSNTIPISTGITPHLRRASLGTPRSRRHPTPARSEVTNDLLFTPLKQVLDERVKRRIRRNGLSEEMNEYDAEKKTKAVLQKEIEDKDAELKRLRAELQEARSAHVQDEADSTIPAASQERVDEIEAELEALRQSFAIEEPEPLHSWDHVPRGTRGPSSVGGDTILIYEDDDVVQDPVDAPVDSDSLAMGLELQAAKQAKQSFLGSFRESTSSTAPRIDFADSPARRKTQDVGPSPRTPRSFYHDLSKQLKATTSRAEDAELALATLENEVLSLGFGKDGQNASSAVSAILDHFRQTRIDLERTMPGETVIGFENARIFPDLVAKLKTFAHQLRAKETELKAARDQHHNLKGNFEKAIVAAERANARVKDLEMAIDTQAEDMLGVRIRAQALEKDLSEKEHDVDCLTAALDKYRDDITRLESLITELEESHGDKVALALSEQTQTISDLNAKIDAETHGRRAAEHSAVSRLAKINELELALSTGRQLTTDLETQLSTLQCQLSSDTSSHTPRLDSLNTRIATLGTALTHANAEVHKLRTIRSKLECRLRDEVENGARAVAGIQADLLRSVAKTNEDKKKYIRGAKVRIANFEMEMEDDNEVGESGGDDASSSVAGGPMTPSSLVRFADLAEEIEFTAGTRLYQNQPYQQHQSQSEGSDNDNDDARSEHIPGSVEVNRGKGRFRRSRSLSGDDLRLSMSPHHHHRHHPRGLAIGMTGKPRRRRYDSGIGMSPVSDEADLRAAFENDEEEEAEVGSACVHGRTATKSAGAGLITPDLSSEGDEAERDGAMEVELEVQ